MDSIILIVVGCVLLYLGVRLILRIREMAGWSDDDPIAGKGSESSTPSGLNSLDLESDDLEDIARLPSDPEDPPAKP